MALSRWRWREPPSVLVPDLSRLALRTEREIRARVGPPRRFALRLPRRRELGEPAR